MSENDIGKRIKHFRLIRGFSQKELAEKIGVSNVVLSRYEASKRTPDTETQIKIADILEVSLDDLYGRNTNSKNSPDPFKDAEVLMFSDKEGFDNLSEEDKQELKDLLNDQLEYWIDKKNKGRE